MASFEVPHLLQRKKTLMNSWELEREAGGRNQTYTWHSLYETCLPTFTYHFHPWIGLIFHPYDSPMTVCLLSLCCWPPIPSLYDFIPICSTIRHSSLLFPCLFLFVVSSCKVYSCFSTHFHLVLCRPTFFLHITGISIAFFTENQFLLIAFLDESFCGECGHLEFWVDVLLHHWPAPHQWNTSSFVTVISKIQHHRNDNNVLLLFSHIYNIEGINYIMNIFTLYFITIQSHYCIIAMDILTYICAHTSKCVCMHTASCVHTYTGQYMIKQCHLMVQLEILLVWKAKHCQTRLIFLSYGWDYSKQHLSYDLLTPKLHGFPSIWHLRFHINAEFIRVDVLFFRIQKQYWFSSFCEVTVLLVNQNWIARRRLSVCKVHIADYCVFILTWQIPLLRPFSKLTYFNDTYRR